MSNLRKAALFIHSLESADQEWLLSQLDPQQRDLVAPPLAELRQFGLACEDAALLLAEMLENESGSEAEVLSEYGIDVRHDLFEGIELANVVRMLRHEHPVVAAGVMGHSDTLYKRVVLAHLPARHRRQAMALEGSAKWSKRVRDVVAKRAREVAGEIARERAARGPLYWLRAVLN